MANRLRLNTAKPRLRTVNTAIVRSAPKQTDPLYRTPEYKQWRANVIDRAGNRCQDEGPHSGPLHADHLVEIKDGGAPFDPRNGICRCQACHNRKTAKARAVRNSDDAPRGHRHPDWLQPSRIPLTIVCGPPASGKTSYVHERAGPRDLVICLDEIASKLAGTTPHGWGREWLDEALRRRNQLLGRLSNSSASRWQRAWLIVSEPWAGKRQWWADKLQPEAIIVLETPDETCWQRIAADPERQRRRSDQSAAVARWWADYERRQSDLVVRPQA